MSRRPDEQFAQLLEDHPVCATLPSHGSKAGFACPHIVMVRRPYPLPATSGQIQVQMYMMAVLVIAALFYCGSTYANAMPSPSQHQSPSEAL